MNKLGFAIKRTSQGASNVIECNKGPWTNKVVDIREYLKYFNGLDGTDTMVTFMSFDEWGCFLTQLKPIPGRVGDSLSGWIYIPNSIEISGKQVVEAYNYVQRILTLSNINDEKISIDDFFSKEYPKKEFYVQYKPTSGEMFGYRILGHYSLSEILDSNRYQPYYSDCKAIFLLDSNSNVKISSEYKNKFSDLTKEQIVQMCILKPSTLGNVQFLGKGVKIVFQDGTEFNSPTPFKKGDKVQLYAVRDGFDPHKLPIIEIKDDIQEMPEIPEKVIWKKRINASMFVVKDEEGELITKAITITVNQNKITNKDTILDENDLLQANVTIKSDGYENYSHTINLRNEPFECTLVPEEKEQQYMIRLSNGHSAKMFLLSKYLYSSSEGQSPLEGYGSDNGVLKISTSYKWKQRCWGVLGTILLGGIIIICIACDAFLDTHRLRFAWPPYEEITPNDTAQTNTDTTFYSDPTADDPQALNEAIEYLDKNKIWKKSKMDAYQALIGLYDDMNNFDLESLRDKWKEKLHDSNTFQKICESAENTLNNHWEPRQGDHNPTWNPDNDESINVTNYINWLDRDQTPPSITDPESNLDKHNTDAFKTGFKEDKKAIKKDPARNVEGNKGNDIFNRPS